VRCSELTKVHEEIVRGRCRTVGGDRRAVERPREVTVVVPERRRRGISVEEIVRAAVEDSSGSSGTSPKEISERTGLSRKEVYGEILRQRNEKGRPLAAFRGVRSRRAASRSRS